MPPRKTPETTQMNLLLCDSKPMMLPDDKQRELAIAQGHTAADRIKQNSGYSSRAVGTLGDSDTGDRVSGGCAGSRPREVPPTEPDGDQWTIHADVC